MYSRTKKSRKQNLKCIIERNSKIQKYVLKVQIQKCIKKKSFRNICILMYFVNSTYMVGREFSHK